MILSTHGFLASSIGQFVPDADAEAFFDRVTTAGGSLTFTEQLAVNQLVLDMKTDGIWTKMKAVYPMVGASAAACAQNLKSSIFTGTFTAGWTFASTGAKPTNAYMDTNFNYNNCALNSIHRSIYVQENYASLGANPCTTLGGSFIGSYINNQWAANDGFGGGTSRITKGFEIVYRNSSTTSKRLRNTFIDSITRDSTSLCNQNAFVGCYNNNGSASDFSSYTFSFASMGDGLTDTEASDFYTAVQAFQTTLSRQV